MDPRLDYRTSLGSHQARWKGYVEAVTWDRTIVAEWLPSPPLQPSPERLVTHGRALEN